MKMKINEDVKEYLRDFNIPIEDGFAYLVTLYFGFNPSYIPDSLRVKVNATGIISTNLGLIQWNVPLFEGQETNFKWVETEYVPLFEEANRDKRGNVKSAVTRMKALFARDPSIRKEEVIGATVLYVTNNDNRFIRQSHYFIEKGRGVERTRDIIEWIDRYREVMKDTSEDRSVTRKLR